MVSRPGSFDIGWMLPQGAAPFPARTHRQACDPNPGPTRLYVDFVPTTSVRWRAAGPLSSLVAVDNQRQLFRAGSRTGRLPASRSGTEHRRQGILCPEAESEIAGSACSTTDQRG